MKFPYSTLGGLYVGRGMFQIYGEGKSKYIFTKKQEFLKMRKIRKKK